MPFGTFLVLTPLHVFFLEPLCSPSATPLSRRPVTRWAFKQKWTLPAYYTIRLLARVRNGFFWGLLKLPTF